MKKQNYNRPKTKNTFICLLHFNLTVWFWDYLMILLVARQFFFTMTFDLLYGWQQADSPRDVHQKPLEHLSSWPSSWCWCSTVPCYHLSHTDADKWIHFKWKDKWKLSIFAALICHIYWRTQTRVMFRPSRSGSSVHWSVVSFCQKEGRHHTMGSGRGV